MKRKSNEKSLFRRILLSPATSISLFSLAAVLFVTSSIGVARSALGDPSAYYSARYSLDDIGVALIEEENPENRVVAQRTYDREKMDGSWIEQADRGVLLQHISDKDFVPGERYDETIKVQNTGTIPQYVRVTIYKYWQDENGKKFTELSPDLIELFPVIGDWVEDTSSKTKERAVYYYRNMLNPGDETTALTNGIRINEKILQYVNQTTNGNTITTKYAYEGKEFCIKATVDAVQNFDAESAIESTWGHKVTINNNTITDGIK